MKKFSSFFSICLILFVIFGNFSSPVLAYEKDGISFDKVITQMAPTENEATSNANVLIEQNKNLNNEELETLKTKKLEEQPLIPKTQNKKFDLNRGLQKNNNQEKLNYVPGEILVKYKNTKINLETISGRATALSFTSSKSLENKEDLRKNNTSVLKIKDAKTVEQKIAELKNDQNVEYAQPNYLYYPTAINTNDTSRAQLWALENTGQTINGTSYSGGVIAGTPNADINAPEAWAINEGTNATVIVAVIDTGVAYNHPDLVNNMWDGSSCVGQDSNGNTISGGCMHGFDFIDNDKIPLPTSESHGTHVAGTIAAVKNNNKGIIGVAPNAKIMALKVDLPTGGLPTSAIIAAINFAEQNGAKIINASFGQSDEDLAEKSAINSFSGLFIAAAGNGGVDFIGDNNENAHFYPSDFDLNNIISVAATDQNDNLASFSNYGATSVDVGAPGVNIYSTIADSIYFSENFEGSSYDIVFGGVTTDNWAVLNDGSSKVAYSDPFTPYDNNAFTYIMAKNSIDLSNSNIKGATLSFTVWCDTPDTFVFDDYILTQHYSNSAWSNSTKYNEDSIWSDGGSYRVDSGYIGYYKNYTEDISDHLTSDFNFSFEWITNASVDNNLGCTIDNIKITKYTDGSDEKYNYYQGTSMAAPHVAGLTALIEGYNPNLTTAQVKNIILTSGDDISALHGKTVAGTRINAYNALNSLIHTISGTMKYYDGIKVIPGATVILEDDIGTQIATTTTDVNGTYQFTGVTSGGNYVVRALKDDNFSTTGVTVSDLIAIKKHTLGTELSDIYKKIAADFNSSLSITVSDLLMIKKFTLERMDGRPASSWKFYSSSATLNVANYLTEGLTRIFTNLIADTPDQDFTGIKMGDVNNSWVNN